jgi:hypothetical protein
MARNVYVLKGIIISFISLIRFDPCEFAFYVSNLNSREK